MKTIFIVNPQAGQGKNASSLVKSIENTIAKVQADAQVYVTKGAGDARSFVKNYCERFGAARFVACGGDGTLNEVLNGAIGFDSAQVGVVPIGTGNDFCRNFSSEYDFENISHQLTGESVKCDAIKYTTVVNDRVKEGYCINMFNIGFDCNVADMTSHMKKKPFISGSFAYFVSILFTLINKKGANLKIELDGQLRHNGKLLLTSVANGCYCGGGIMSNPLASIKDGYININIIKNVSRLKFISLLPYYMKGTYLNLTHIDKYISSEKCKKITITPNDGSIRLFFALSVCRCAVTSGGYAKCAQSALSYFLSDSSMIFSHNSG